MRFLGTTALRILFSSGLFLLAFNTTAVHGAELDSKRGSCSTFVKALARVKNITRQSAVSMVSHTGKALYYPLVLGFRAGKTALGTLNGKEHGKISHLFRDIWKNDKWHAAVFSTLLALSYGTTVSFSEFEAATAAFDQAEPAGVTVVVEGFQDDDFLYPAAGTYVHATKYRDKENVVFLKLTENTDFTEELEKIVARNGTIGKLDYYGHGLPGNLNGVDLNVGNLSELFSPGAQVRFNSCFLANGRLGGFFLDLLEKDLSVHGGTIYASALQMTANPVEYAALKFNTPEPPYWLRNAAQPLRTPLGLWTSAEVAGHRESIEFPPQDRIVIRHVLPAEKAWPNTENEERLSEYVAELRDFEEECRLSRPFMRKHTQRILELPAPGQQNKKIGEIAEWDLSFHKWNWAATATLPRPQAIELVAYFKTLNLKGIEPYFSSSIKDSTGQDREGILLYFSPNYRNPERAKKGLALYRRGKDLEKALFGEDARNETLQRAKAWMEERQRSGAFKNGEFEIAEVQARRTLDRQRQEWEGALQRVKSLLEEYEPAALESLLGE
jgi:hypothetical protein